MNTLNRTPSDCENGIHGQVVLDEFSLIPGVRRYVPGDCYCLACRSPIPARWNNGEPQAIPPEQQ